MEQRRDTSRINTSKPGPLPVAALGKSEIQAVSSLSYKVILGQVLRNKSTSSTMSPRMNINREMLQQEYSMLKPGRTSLKPGLVPTYPIVNTNRQMGYYVSPGNGIARKKKLPWPSSQIKTNLFEKPAHKEVQTHNLPGAGMQPASQSIPERTGRLRLASINKRLSPGAVTPLHEGIRLSWRNTPVVKMISPERRSNQVSGKGQEIANNTDISRWTAMQPKNIEAISRFIRSGVMLPAYEYRPVDSGIAGVHIPHGNNKRSRQNNLMTGLFPTKGLDAGRSWSANPDSGITGPVQAKAPNNLPSFYIYPGQAGHRFSDYHIQRQNQVLRQRKTDLYRVKQQKSLVPAWPLKPGKNAPDQVKQQKMLLPVRSLLSEKTILKQVDHQPSLLYARPLISAKTALDQNKQLSLMPTLSMTSEKTEDQVKQQKKILLARPLLSEKTVIERVNRQPSLLLARPLLSEKTVSERFNQQPSISPARLPTSKNAALDRIKQRLSLMPARSMKSEKNALDQGKLEKLLSLARSLLSEKTVIKRVKQQLSLLPARPLISGNMALDRIKQRLSLMPAGSLKSKKNALDQVKLEKSLSLARPLLSEKTAIERVKQQLSLLPARPLISRNTALDQIKRLSLMPARSMKSEKNALDQGKLEKSLSLARPLLYEKTVIERVKQQLSLLPARPLISNKTALDQTKQRLSLVPARSLKSDKNTSDKVKQQETLLPVRTLLAGKTVLERFNKQSLMPARLLRLEKNALERTMQSQRSYEPAFLAAYDVIPDARIKVQNKTGSTPITIYPVSYPAQDRRHNRIGTLPNGFGVQLSRGLSYVNEKGKPSLYDTASVYDSRNLPGKALQYSRRSFVSDISNQQPGSYRNVLGANHSLMKDIYMDGARSRFYPALPVAAATGAREGMLPWQNRMNTMRRNILGPGNPIYHQLIKEPKRQVQDVPRINSANRTHGMIPDHSEAVPNRYSNQARFGENQHKSDRRSHFNPNRRSRMLHERFKRQPGSEQINNNHGVILKTPVPGWRNNVFSDFVYHKTAMAAAAEDGQSLKNHDSSANSRMHELQIRARNKETGRTGSRMTGRVLPLSRTPGILDKYRGYKDQVIPLGSSRARIMPYAKLTSSSLGTVNNRNKDLAHIFRTTSMAGLEKGKLSILPTGRPAMIMRKAAAGTINNALATSKRAGEISSGRNRAKPETSDFINRSLDTTVSKLGLTTEKQLKHYRQENTRSGWWPEWFINKLTGLVKTTNTNGKLSKMAGNPGFHRAMNNLHRGNSEKETAQIFKTTAKIIPFKQSAHLSREAYQSGQMVGHHINRPGQQKISRKHVKTREMEHYINRPGKDKRDIYYRGIHPAFPTGTGLSGNARSLPTPGMLGGVAGRGILAGSPQGKLSAVPSDHWINRYKDQGRAGGKKKQAGIFNIKRDQQADRVGIRRGADKLLIAGDKNGLPFNPPNPSLIPHRGIKAGEDKRLASYSTLASGTDLNYRRPASPAASNMAQNTIDTKLESINADLKMQMVGAKNTELKASEIKKIADRVYMEIQQRMKSERQRRGL